MPISTELTNVLISLAALLGQLNDNLEILKDETRLNSVPTEVAIIMKYAKDVGADPIKAVNIAYEESEFNPIAKNPNSSATGAFQIIDGTWKKFECIGVRKDFIDNTKCAMKILTTSGDHHWLSSYDYPCGNRRCGWKYRRYM